LQFLPFDEEDECCLQISLKQWILAVFKSYENHPEGIVMTLCAAMFSKDDLELKNASFETRNTGDLEKHKQEYKTKTEVVKFKYCLKFKMSKL